MPKIARPTMAYIVSFNTVLDDGTEVGGGSDGYDTQDFEGDDIDALAAEVIADDTDKFMGGLKFIRAGEDDCCVGRFVTVEDEDYLVAVMLDN